MNMSWYCQSGLKAPRGVELCCPLCCSPEKETWSDYSQTLLLSYLWLSHRRERGRDRKGKKKKKLMMWLKHGPAVLKWPKWLTCLILLQTVTFSPCFKKQKTNRQKKSHNSPAAITEAKRSLGWTPRLSDVHWLQDARPQSTFFPNTVKKSSVGEEILLETFQMPLDSEVEAN